MCPEPGMVTTFHVNRLDLESGFDFLQIQVRWRDGGTAAATMSSMLTRPRVWARTWRPAT